VRNCLTYAITRRIASAAGVLAAAMALISSGLAATRAGQSPPAHPNIVIILADDLGYGDIASFNPNGRVPTPHVDRLAREGVRFTDAHSNSSVCTPTRYGLLTGRYAWRTSLTAGVLWGEGDPLIEPGRVTLPSLLKSAGYTTDGVGKWHLGLSWAAKPGRMPTTRTRNQIGWIDFASPFSRGPRTIGFDRYFGIVASLDMPPYVYIEDDGLAAPVTTTLPGIPEGDPAFYRPGPASAGFRPETVLEDLTSRAERSIAERARGPQPFLLYVALAAPHTPVMPGASFKGKTGIGSYGDFVAETDAAVGRMLNALDKAGVSDRTLVLFTSDNGPAPLGGIAEAAKHGHDAAGGWRGTKAGLYEGGHRVPFVVRWPGRVPAGQTSTHSLVMTDVLATVAEIAGIPLQAGSAEDSVSFAASLREPSRARGRDAAMVLHSQNGSFAIRDRQWKLILTHGSGADADVAPRSEDGQLLPSRQLYDLATDPKERVNLAAKEPAIVERLETTLRQYRESGRSRPSRP
jgi:arylsulfatase A